MGKFRDMLNEATVGVGNTYKASDKVVKFIEKRLNVTFTLVDGQEFANNAGTFFGYLYVNPESNAAIRINWDRNEFYSISWWNDYASEMAPAFEIFTGKIAPGQSSFARLLPELVEIIQNGGSTGTEEEFIEEPEDEITESADLNEDFEYNGKTYKSKVEIVNAMYDEGKSVDEIKAAVGYPPGHIRNLIARHTGENDPKVSKSGAIKVVKGQSEQVLPSKTTKKAQQMLDDTEYADPDIVFKDLASYVTLVGKGYMPALLITGQGGTGKSYTVTDILKKYGNKGEDYVIMKGHCTPSAMYKFLYYHYNQICVFDDCDSIFDSADGMNVLKGALDSGDPREISWMTKGGDIVDTFGVEDHAEIEARLAEWSAHHGGKEGTPSYFQFEGAAIFISNMTIGQVYKKDRALPTRCTCIDVTLSAKGIVHRIETVLPHIKIYAALRGRGKAGTRDITDDAIKREVFEYISSDTFLNDPRMRGRELNFRMFNQIYTYRFAELPDWKELAFRAGGGVH